MINPIISHNKTLFDIFNMINPNCYQALIIQAIIEDRKEEAIQLCDELSTAFEYYKWESNAKQSGYTDALICDSSLDQWKKLAIIRIISNNVKQCKEIIKKEVESSRSYYKTNRNHRPTITLKIADLHKMLDFNKFV